MTPESAQNPRWTGSSTIYLDTQARDAWREDAQRQGRRGSQRILDAVETQSPFPELGERVICRRRLMLLDESPVELVASYWPHDIAAGTALAGTRRVQGGTAAYLAELGFTPAAVDEYVEAAAASTEDAPLLGVAPGTPALVLVREIRSNAGRLYEVTRMTTPAGAGRLHYSLRIDDGH